jgi:hypothetical protein
MYEVFPIVAGAILALIVPRFVSDKQRNWAFGVSGIAVAALATIIAGEEWFFIFIDLALVFLAIGATLYIVRYVESRNTLRLP